MARLIIVGAGAAGLFAAGAALEGGHAVTLVERMEAPGKKLAITGKGRCNLTNACNTDVFLQNIRRNPKFLYSAVSALPPRKVMAFFEERLGVPLITERGRRVFPQSGDAREVVNALVRRAGGAQGVRGRVIGLHKENGRAAGVRLEDGNVILADAVLLATGGMSYPITGSTGDGYRLAKEAGHSIEPPLPSLVSLVAAQKDRQDCERLAGLSLRNVRVSLLQNGKAVFVEQGEMLFTHFGLSGPVILSASAHIGDMTHNSYEVSIDLKPALPQDKLDARILRDFTQAAGRNTANALNALLPLSLRPVVIERWGEDGAGRVNQLTRQARLRLGGLLKDFRITLAARGDLAHAVITGGGVRVREVDPKTMQSRLLPGLYFAGEVLDVDGYTGGYNLHIAWATAFAAVNALG